MNDKILLTLLDSLRNETLVIKERILVCLMLLAWWKTSNRKNVVLPENLKINNCAVFESLELKAVFNNIFLATNDDSFNEENSSKLSKVSNKTLGGLIDQVSMMGANGHLENFNPTDVSLLVTENETNLPIEVVDFMVLLAGDRLKQEVYLPWENTGQFAGRVINNKGVPIIESDAYSDYINLIATIMTDQPIKVLHNDLFTNPALVENGQLIKLPLAIAHLRSKTLFDKNVFEYDLLGRFKPKIRTFPGLAICHLLKQIKGRIIITVPESFLFSGFDRTLREDLAKDQQIEAVLSMPRGVLGGNMSSFSIVILNTEKKCPLVRFVNIDASVFSSVISKTQKKLINIEKLREVIESDHEDENIRNVSANDILNNNASLLVSYYVLNKQESEAAKFIAKMLGVALHSFAELIAPKVFTSSPNGIEVAEVGASDLPAFGYIRNASKILTIEVNNKRITDMFLRPNDIILVIKGSVGKVGIVPEDVPKDYWLAGRSSVVIRLHQDSSINAKALFMLLRSDLGKELLNRIGSRGSAIPFIQLKQLQDLLIPVPTENELAQAVAVLEEEDAIQKEILTLQKRQTELSLNFWRIN
jgi:type I restriction enzyme M protein